jgi:hypothetical protein
MNTLFRSGGMLPVFLLLALFSRGEPVFNDNTSGDTMRWKIIDGPDSIAFAPHPKDNETALRLGNSIIKAPLSRGITGASLVFQASFGVPRMVQVALMDAKGEKGLIVWYDSSMVGFGLLAHEGEWRWGRRHEGRRILWQKKTNPVLGELHRFALNYDAPSGELTLSVDGEEAGSAALPLSVRNLAFSQIYIWGNDGSWFRNIVVNTRKGDA